MRAAAIALLSVWAAASFELALVLVLHRAELTSTWEAKFGAMYLAPTALLLTAPFGLVGALLFQGFVGASRAERWIATAVAAVAAGSVAALVTTGRHFDESLVRAAFSAVVALAAGGLAWALHPWLGARLRGSPRAFAAAALGLAVGLELLNRFVLVRLYPAFHTGLGAASLALAAMAALAFLARQPAQRSRVHAAAAVAAVALLASAGLARPAADGLARFDNFRLLVSDHAPILAHAVRVAALISPPAPLDTADLCDGSSGCGAAPGASAGPSFAGRDILLVTIDALRADHLGAYGYGRATTPHIDALARDAVVFDHAYCPTPHTSYSITSMMTGKYMRPLLLQGVGQDSDTLASILRIYGYKTAAFYPPAVFFIDQARFEPFEHSHYGFEYRKVEFMEGEGRVEQVDDYLRRRRSDQRVFVWVHLFGPHEPYEAHPEHPFGDRDVDRYDSEIAAADDTVGELVEHFRKARPASLVIVTADHGEEFGEHGGRYHGTTVYEEQVRVPLIVSAPGLLPARRVATVVQTIDVLPTVLAGLSIPASPRIRGRSLGGLLAGGKDGGPGFAFVETEEQALLAEGTDRLVCERKLGACRLFDISKDPDEHEDIAPSSRERFDKLRAELSAFGASHGRFEREGLRAETGRGWPAPILRGIAGDGDAAADLATLLDDSDREIRRKAAELLFQLRRPESVEALTLSLGRDEDAIVRRFSALALTRMGRTAPLAFELLSDPDPTWRRRAALALGDAGDAHAGPVLVDWWQHGGKDDHDQALSILDAFARVRSKDAVWPLVHSLDDVRLRPRIAEVLATIGDSSARGPLVAALGRERFQTARVAIADALVALGAKDELARPLVRFLGVPDPLPGGLGYAERAGVLEQIGGPDKKTRPLLATQSDVGVRVSVLVPKGVADSEGVRVLVRGRADDGGGQVRVGRSQEPILFDSKGNPTKQREAPRIHDRDYVALTIPKTATPVEVYATLPPALGARPGRPFQFVLFAERSVHVESVAVVPLAPELPPPAPEPWTPSDGDEDEKQADR
ncbi:MAG TPA: sulfatase-like hydrolase/transferase [Polyangiaceae bacterium]|nr:sulfatase-like hydrolase/transferase [Polyangiaceae bacterium]